jgi:hypothetical protein
MPVPVKQSQSAITSRAAAIRRAVGSRTRFTGTCTTKTTSQNSTERRLAQAEADCIRAAHAPSTARKTRDASLDISDAKPSPRKKGRGSPKIN